jgi:hypothetical protein
MRFYDVPVNRSVPTEANRGLTSYKGVLVRYSMKLNTMDCKSSLCFAIYWMEPRVISLLSGIVGIKESALDPLLSLFHREREIMKSILTAAWLVARLCADPRLFRCSLANLACWRATLV